MKVVKLKLNRLDFSVCLFGNKSPYFKHFFDITGVSIPFIMYVLLPMSHFDI